MITKYHIPEPVEPGRRRYSIIDSLYKPKAWWDWLDGYMESRVWKDKRALVFQRANDICECCRLEPAEMCHHLHYKHVGAEPLWDLVAICGSCHDDLHRRNQ